MATSESDNNKELNLFWQIGQTMASRTYLEEILQLIVSMTATVMGSKICSLMLLDEEKKLLKIAATQALSSEYVNKPPVKVGESVAGRAVKEGKPVLVPDLTREKNYQFPLIAAKEGIVAMLCVPMFANGNVIGVINSYKAKEHRFTEREVKTLQAVANQAAVAIENTKLRKENAAVKQAFEERKLIDQAKGLLMEKDGMKESEAYRLLQKTSRDRRLSMAEVANAIILTYSIRPQKP